MSRSAENLGRRPQQAILFAQSEDSMSNSMVGFGSVSNAMQDQGPVENKCLIANDEQMQLLALTLQF